MKALVGRSPSVFQQIQKPLKEVWPPLLSQYLRDPDVSRRRHLGERVARLSAHWDPPELRNKATNHGEMSAHSIVSGNLDIALPGTRSTGDQQVLLIANQDLSLRRWVVKGLVFLVWG